MRGINCVVMHILVVTEHSMYSSQCKFYSVSQTPTVLSQVVWTFPLLYITTTKRMLPGLLCRDY